MSKKNFTQLVAEEIEKNFSTEPFTSRDLKDVMHTKGCGKSSLCSAFATLANLGVLVRIAMIRNVRGGSRLAQYQFVRPLDLSVGTAYQSKIAVSLLDSTTAALNLCSAFERINPMCRMMPVIENSQPSRTITVK